MILITALPGEDYEGCNNFYPDLLLVYKQQRFMYPYDPEITEIVYFCILSGNMARGVL